MQIENPVAFKINECHSEFVALGRRNAESIVAQINKAREIGLLLKAEQERLRELRKDGASIPPWKKCFAENGATDCPFLFSHSTAKNYMRVSDLLADPIETLPEGVRVLTDIFRMSDALPAPEREEGQTAHDPGFFGRSVKQVNGFLALLGKWKESEPVDNWSPQQREDMKAQLQPVMEFYQSL